MFFGALRSIAPLLALRVHLMLPEDTMGTVRARIYLKVVSLKTANRGLGRQQYASVDHPLAVQSIVSIFGSLNLRHQLWPGSPSAFRRRWDAVCKTLILPEAVATFLGALLVSLEKLTAAILCAVRWLG